jgi:glycosyltransferase involved in cell wall biosynthesis
LDDLSGQLLRPDRQSADGGEGLVVVPAIWCENSRVVIKENFFFGLPVNGSDIGGTVEKANNCGGITFTALSEVLLGPRIVLAIVNADIHQAHCCQIGATIIAHTNFGNYNILYVDRPKVSMG